MPAFKKMHRSWLASASPLLLLFAALSFIALAGSPPPSGKLESSLARLAATSRPGASVTAIIEPQGGASGAIDQAALRELGARIEARSSDLLRARLPLDRLNEIATRVPGIRYIRRPYRWAPLGQLQLSQGLLPTGGLLFQSQGFRGQGVKVAIIDAGFSGLYWAVKHRVLAAGAIVFKKDYTGKGLLTGGEHGSAVAEIVHEMAPRAQLYLMKIGDEVDLENAVDDAIRLGVRVINCSLGWFDTDFDDGTGLINEIARRARAAGILWVNAAGNQAQAHWIGRFRDSNHDGWAEFALGKQSLALKVPLGGLIDLVLVWNDWPTTDQDYDLYLTDAQGKVLASSQNRQTGTQPPREELQYVADHPGVYFVRVRAHWATRPMWLRLFQIESGAYFEKPIPHGSLVAPADCSCTLAVGAVNRERWSSGPQESFSALGPTFDGRIKPDLVGPDGIDNLFFSNKFGGFLGTSAAAPHVAGAAALLLSQHPGWSTAQLKAALRGDATDLGPPGPDVTYGAGELDLILGWPSAERHVQHPGSAVQPGERLVVSIDLQMPLGRFGGLRLQEEPPAGFRIVPLDNGGGEFDPESSAWSWPTAAPGQTIRLRYALVLSPEIKPGRYRLKGTINGRPVEGDSLLTVGQGWSLRAELAGLRPQRRASGYVWPALMAPGTAGRGWRLQVFDLAGRVVFSLSATIRRALVWSEQDRLGAPVATGVYLYLVTVDTAQGQTVSSGVQKLAVRR